MFYVTRFILSNTGAMQSKSSQVHKFTIVNQAVSNAFRHVLSVIAHKTHQFSERLSFDEGVNSLLDTGVL
ncbi:MAG: hypothetical protein ACI936_002963 [Paraglaciecola sp.]|jgi:hypothetical protein